MVKSLTGMAVTWTLFKALFTLLLMVCAVVIRASINILSNSASFWLRANSNALAYTTHTVGDFGKYPLGVFPQGVRMLISVAVPYAFVSFFPASYIFGKKYAAVGLATPLVAVVFATAAIWVFYTGLKRYDSVGN